MPDPQPAALLVFGIKPVRIGGIELQTRAAAEHLRRRGWNCVLAFHNVPKEPVLSYLSLDNVIWDQLPDSWINSRKTALGLIRLLRKYRPRILHLQFTPALSMFPWLARCCGVQKIYFTDHSSRPEAFIPQRAPWAKRTIGRLLDQPITKVVAVSDYNRRTFLEWGYLPPGRVTRIYNGTDLTLDRHAGCGEVFRRRYAIPLERPLIVQVCAMIRDKGVGDLLEAARIALATDPDLHFALVGEGPQRELFMEKARGLNIDHRVTWTGLIEEPHSAGVYAAADIVCQMSRWEEAQGMVLLEAMLYAKPLLGTRVGGIPEMIREGETGFLVDRGDAGAMAARILDLARDRDLRRRLGRAARNLAELEFDVRQTSLRWMEVYGIPPTP